MNFLQPGHEAEFVVVYLRATPLLARQTSWVKIRYELLFALIAVEDDRGANGGRGALIE